MSKDKAFKKCSDGKGCNWCNDIAKGKERWFANYLENKKYISDCGTYSPQTPCVCIVFEGNVASEKLEKNKAMQAWRQYKNRRKSSQKGQINVTLDNRTIKAIKLSANQENRPVNVELEIIINTYLEMKDQNKLDDTIMSAISNKVTKNS